MPTVTGTNKSNTTFIAFSMATKNSWKNRKTGEWASRTEWHRAVVFGRLTAFAATLKKGDRVQIQGQLRTREYVKDDAKKTVTEVAGHVSIETQMRLFHLRVIFSNRQLGGQQKPWTEHSCQSRDSLANTAVCAVLVTVGFRDHDAP
jgi:single stranded DNA-binding protein